MASRVILRRRERKRDAVKGSLSRRGSSRRCDFKRRKLPRRGFCGFDGLTQKPMNDFLVYAKVRRIRVDRWNGAPNCERREIATRTAILSSLRSSG
jgi:hypothetical protein